MRSWMVEVAATAEQDLARATDYIASVLKNRQAALSLVDEFEECCAALASMPEARPAVSREPLASRGYRWIPVGNYLVFFTLDHVSRTVYVERFLYGRSDYLSVL